MTYEIDITDWPECPVDGCPNKACRALDSSYCFVHTPGNEHVKRMDIDARHAARSGVIVLESAEDAEVELTISESEDGN